MFFAVLRNVLVSYFELHISSVATLSQVLPSNLNQIQTSTLTQTPALGKQQRF